MSGVIYLQQSKNRNYFINPNFQVNQINLTGILPNSLALPTASLGYPSGSNWCFAASGSSAVSYAIDPASESVTFTGAASTTGIYLMQRLESKDVTTLANKLATLTLSAEISNSLLTSVIWEVFRPTTSNDVHGTIASPTQTLIASGTFTVSSTLTRYSASFTLPALASRGLELRLRVGAQTSGVLTVARLQLEEGSVATDFNCGDYISELLKCQRYFYATSPSLNGTSGSSLQVARAMANHPIKMFSVPIIALSGVLNVFDGVTITASSIFLNTSTVDCIEIDLTVDAPVLTLGNSCIVYQGGGGTLSVFSSIP